MFDEYITLQARSQPNAPAILMEGREISFAQFDADINRVAAALQAYQLAGETVAVAVRMEYLSWLTVLALARLGATSAPAPEKTARFTVTDQAGEGHNTGYLPISAERILQGPEVHVTPVRRDPDTIGRLMHTSGTTGTQKTIAATWRAIYEFLGKAALPPGPRLLTMRTDTPAGFGMPLTSWATGNAVIAGGAAKATPDMLALRPVLVDLPPDQLRRLLDALPADFLPMPEMRVSLAGATVPPALAREARRRLTPNLVSVYGTSECGAVAIAEGPLLEEKAGVAGYVIPGTDVEIVDVRDRPVPAGTQGRIRVRSPYLPSGYLDDPERTAKSFRDGWFYPGDLGRMLEDGLLMIDGRADDLMNFGGYKVLPALVEEAVLTCPGIRDAAAFAVPDERGLDRCWLALVTGEGFDPERLVPAIRGVLVRTPPIRWITVSNLPRNAMGKVQRDRLRAAVLRQELEAKTAA